MSYQSKPSVSILSGFILGLYLDMFPRCVWAFKLNLLGKSKGERFKKNMFSFVNAISAKLQNNII